jgi:glycine/D-amino acid oxidase-like deaminating enzyme
VRQAGAVVIGGGTIGCSVAYHLTALGWRDVIRLDVLDGDLDGMQVSDRGPGRAARSDGRASR